MRIFLIALLFTRFIFSQDTRFLVVPVEEKNLDFYADYIYDNPDSENGYVALIRLIEIDINNKNWNKAISTLEEFKYDFPTWESNLNKIIEILKQEEEGLSEFNLGDGINSKANERAPIQTADESTLYFTAVNREGENNTSDDIFYSKNINNYWTPAKKLEASFNTLTRNESPMGISTDGNTMFLFGKGFSPNGNGDVFYADRTEFGWSNSESFPNPINTLYFESDANLTNTGDALLFVSDRPGGVGEYHKYGDVFFGSQYGNTDIYIAPKNEDGTWGEPINLGDVINTPYAERKPFLHPDGKTLYFASEGHPGLGRLDLFMSKRLSDTSWTEWSEPINFGKEVNTTQNERSAVVNTMGQLAYFSSEDRPLNFGKSDIYSMEMPEAVVPEPIYAINGTVVDPDGFPLEADIIWEDLDTGEQLGKMRSNPQDGTFFIILPKGRNYGFYSEKEGYFPNSQNIDLVDLKRSEKVTKNIEMTRLSDIFGDDLELTGGSDLLYDAFDLKKKRKLKMNNLFFEYNSAELLKSSFPELDRVAYVLKNYSIQLIEVSGHTDSIGNPEYNQRLSEKRANSVKSYLISKGIEPKTLEAKGYGQSEPIATNETEEGRQQNRRVELLILKSGSRVIQD
jgi:outer membrane protein OmpA-like peptidoglycan-associated protein